MPGGKPADYYEISMKQFDQQILPAGMPATTVWGYGAVSVGEPRGLLLHNAPSLTIETPWKRPVRIKWINDLKDANGNYLPHLLPVDPTLHWANPPGGAAGGTRGRLHSNARSLHRAGADRDPPARRRRGGRRERRLRRGLVPAGRGQHPGGLRDRGHLVRLLRREGRIEVRRQLGSGVCDLPVPQRPARVDAVVPRPRARHDPAQRVRGPGGLLPGPRRPRGGQGDPGQPHGHHGRAAQPRAQRGRPVPAQQDLLRDPDRGPGPLVQRRRVPVLPGHAGVLRRLRRPLHPRDRHLADLEPRVLRQHDHGQRQHLAVPDGGAAPLPAALPERLPVALPDPRLQRRSPASRSGRSATRAASWPRRST